MIGILLTCLCLSGLVMNAALGQSINLCERVADGKVVRVNCHGFVKCKSQTPQVVTCEPGTVLERDSFTCKPIGTGNTICGMPVNCTGTGFLPSPNCQSFFYCSNDTFLENSHIYCPEYLLFDGNICNYPSKALPPCGTPTTKP